MAMRPRQWLRSKLRQRAQDEWHQLLGEAPSIPQRRLRVLHDEAQALGNTARQFLARSELLLSAPVEGRSLDRLNLPAGTDWRWRPSILTTPLPSRGIAAPSRGARIGEETAIWHDCPASALILRQERNDLGGDLAPYGLRLETLGFSGSYLSMSIDLPQSALDGLTRSHIVRLDVTLGVERPISIYGRLNIGNGPNTDELLRHLSDLTPGNLDQTRVLEFDLHYADMNEKRLEKLWLDLIFESPQMNAVSLRDIVLSRHLRADI